jgi:glycosyltransferase involved in cell wall biosynthesis
VTRPILSVVIPTRDRRVLLRRAIEYFERRDPFVDAELIIVDGGKWPLSKEDVSGHRLIRVEGDGFVGERLNIGVKEARGEFILRQDDDDWYAPDWYYESLQTVSTAPSGMAGVTNFYAYDIMGGKCWRWAAWGEGPEAANWSGGSMTFRKSIWERSPFRLLPVGSDREFILDAYKLGLPARSMVSGGTNKYLMIRHARNLTAAGKDGTGTWADSSANPKFLPEIKRVLGNDMIWYEDLKELLSLSPKAEELNKVQELAAHRGVRPLGHSVIRL